MKKLLIAIMTVVLLFAVVGCNNAWKSTVTEYAGEVSSNGGFAVQKGDWVYYVNGVEQNTSDNTFGSVVKGAIVRAKISELGNEQKTSEVVVPEIVYSTQMGMDNGLFIFGDYIYYATPCSDKDADGVVRNGETEYMKTKLDGSETKKIAQIASNSDPYRFVQIANTCYLAIYTKNDDGKNVIRVYNADTQVLVKESKEVVSYAFPSDVTNNYAYYTTKVHNDALDSDESFNAVYRIALDGSEEVEILNGAGTYSDSVNGIGIAGVTFEIVKNTGKDLILKETAVQTSSVSVYKGVKASEIVNEKSGETPATKLNYDKLITLDNGSSLATKIFATSSIYVGLDAIFYFDTTYGIVKYNYNNASNQNFGREKVYYNEDILSANLKYIEGGIAYFENGGTYYSLDLASVIDLNNGDIKADVSSVEPKRLNYVTINTSWYQPEMVGKYLLAVVDAEPYYSYVYAFDTTVCDGKTAEEVEDYIADISKVDRERILARKSGLVGIMTQTDSDAFNTFMDEKYPEKKDDSSASNS